MSQYVLLFSTRSRSNRRTSLATCRGETQPCASQGASFEE